MDGKNASIVLLILVHTHEILFVENCSQLANGTQSLASVPAVGTRTHAPRKKWESIILKAMVCFCFCPIFSIP